MRAFVAISVPGHMALDRAYTALGTFGGPVKAVLPSNMHLTLKFIGETSIPVRDLLMAMEEAASGRPPFTLNPSGAGAFPNWSRPSVVWVGFGDGDAPAELAGSIERLFADQFSIEPEGRRFSPHLTLARVKGPTRVGELRTVAESAYRDLASDHYSIPVSSIRLMSSTLTPKGPIYEEAGKVVLRG